MSAQIQILIGPDRGRAFPVEPGPPLQVGRGPATATRLTDPAVSRLHCEIAYDGALAVLTNQSNRGTQVNGQAVTRQELRHGDLVRIGGTEFRFLFRELEEAETVLQEPTGG